MITKLSLGMKIGIGVALLAGISLLIARPYRSDPLRLMTADPVRLMSADPVPSQPVITDLAEPSQPEVADLPAQLLHQAPFTTQAPGANWDIFHEEMCEEAAMIIAWRYYLGDTTADISSADADRWLNAVAAWEREQLGTDVSTTIEAAYQTMVGYFGIEANKLQIIPVTGADDLKRALQQGVVIAPFAGRLLGNPNFRGAGPRYHMLTIIGFEDDTFITHDVGTRRGAFYRYKASVLLAALHDFVPEDQDIITGQAVALVVTR